MAIILDMGVTGEGIAQPLQKQKWQLEFIGLSADGQGLKQNAVTCELPKLEFERIQLDAYNSRAYIAGKHTFQPINIVLRYDTGGRVQTALVAQLERQQNLVAVAPSRLMPSSAAGALYKFGLRINLLDGNETRLQAWALEGCWINNGDFGDLDYASGEPITATMTLSYDHARNLITGVDLKAHNGPTPL